MRLLVTRPKVDADVLAFELEQSGHQVLVAPLMEIVPRVFLPEIGRSLGDFQAVLFTSANGVRAFASQVNEPPGDLMAFCVGAASGQAARDAGWQHVEDAGGDVDALAALVMARLDPSAGPLLHLSGKAAAGDLAGALGAQGFGVTRCVGYEARPAAKLPDEACKAIAAGALEGVLLFSPRSAEIYGRLVARAGLGEEARLIAAYCLSQAVADGVVQAFDEGFAPVCQVAPIPETSQLLALLSP